MVLRNVVLIIGAQLLVIVAVISLEIYYLRVLHDQLTSRVRSGASSAVSTLGRLIIIPLALIFGAASQNGGIFHAAWILVVAATVLAGTVIYTQQRQA